MDKTKIDAIGQAMLEPDLHAQDKIRKKRAAKARNVARRRQVAWFTLIGGGIPPALKRWPTMTRSPITWTGFK
jgi:hypothetical protein